MQWTWKCLEATGNDVLSTRQFLCITSKLSLHWSHSRTSTLPLGESRYTILENVLKKPVNNDVSITQTFQWVNNWWPQHFSHSSGQEVAVVYYRAGYTPRDYPSDKVSQSESSKFRVIYRKLAFQVVYVADACPWLWTLQMKLQEHSMMSHDCSSHDIMLTCNMKVLSSSSSNEFQLP